MKYGLIDFNLTVEDYWNNSWNKKALLNIGDAVEYEVVEQIYRKIGIKDNDIVRLSIKELTSYRGEFLIVGINIAFDSYVGYNDILENLSPNIIPVFLGISLTDLNMNQKQLDCLRSFAPVGCRDQRTYLYLKQNCIECYLNGCTASILDINLVEKEEQNSDKILFIDVPRKVKNFIPEQLKKDIVFVNQELYCKKNEFKLYKNPKAWMREVLKNYKNPRLIVTSRFHGAVLSIANNIPCILTLEKYTFRFSWLKKYFSIYTEENFENINWDVQKQNYDILKQIILNIAIKRIQQVTNKYEELLRITELQFISDLDESNSSNQVLYYNDVIDEINLKWNKNDKIKYGFWGINDNTYAIFKFISNNYPNAELIDVYDMFKNIEFHGIKSVDPRNLGLRKNDEQYYVIVTAYLASRIANDVFEEVNFNSKNAFLCKREFVENKHL